MFPPLPEADAEARAVGASFRSSTVLTGRQATLRAVLRELPEAEILHFAGHALADAVNHICSKPRAWLEFMMAHELQLAPLEESQARKSAILVGFAAILGSLIPLVPFLVFPSDIILGMIGALVVAAVVLFLIGWYKGKTTIGRPYRSGTQMLIIGIVSAVAGFLIAYLVGAAP